MERTVKVTGKGKIAVKPDIIRLAIDLKGVEESYEKALQQSARQTEMLRDCFEGLGFEKTDLKTTSFRVNTKYENSQNKMGVWKQKFVGYEFWHSLKIEFGVDNQLLGKMLYALAHSQTEPEFHILYTVKDVESVKNLLLGKAVEDAKTKAQVLADAAGVTLGEIMTIDYSWEEMEIISRPMNQMKAVRCMAEESDGASYDMAVEPDDIDVSDHVTVIWAVG